MATTHVFIVDDKTFKVHLEYLFAGTGGKNTNMSFVTDLAEKIHHSKENNVMGMIADANRVRKDDNIVFYLQQTSEHEGKFFGVFKAVSDFSFIEDNGAELKEELGKCLTFRTLIKPHKVYKYGISEWDLLDNISSVDTPQKMMWSLIYRKLKGNRGNTMITLYEAQHLEDLLSHIPNNEILNASGFSFNCDDCSIEIAERKIYPGHTPSIDVFSRMKAKYDAGKAYEAHLQAYIVKNISITSELKNLILNNQSLEWLGNEVYCGVGMQRIDIACTYTNNNKRFIAPIELKAVEVYPNIIKQIKRYVDWIKLYFKEINEVDCIQPVVIAPKCSNRSSADYINFIERVKEFNQQENVLPIKYIEFFIDNDIHFNKVAYDN